MAIGFQKIKTDKLIKAKWNYKLDDEAKRIKLTNQIKKNGQVENILVREISKGNYEVVNGNHRLDTFIDLKYKEVWAYNFGKISQAQAERIAIETNETSFDNDPIKLAESITRILKEFKIEEVELTMPYSQDELKDFSTLLNFNWKQYEKEEVAGDNDSSDLKEIKLKVDKNVYESWDKWTKRIIKLTGDKRPERAFELAIIEALNVPVESLSA